MQDINVGLIGCGRIASLVYLNILKKLPGLKLTAIAESDTVKREKAGMSAPHAALYPDYKDLLLNPNVNAVIICLPNHIHSEAAIASFESGKHVYLEKPIAINVTRADEVIRAWKESDRVAMMGFNLRFNPLSSPLTKPSRFLIAPRTNISRTSSSNGSQEASWNRSVIQMQN